MTTWCASFCLPLEAELSSSLGMEFMIRSLCCRALAEEDITSNGSRPIAEAVGEAATALYSSGSVASSKLPSLNAWLTKEKCMFPDVIESLALGHLEKGDHMTAMITSEWLGFPLYCLAT